MTRHRIAIRPREGLVRLLLFGVLLSLLATRATAESFEAPPIAVSTTTISQSKSYTVSRTYAGQIEHRRTSHLGFELPGTIQNVHVNEGDTVKQGDVLVTQDQSSIAAEVKAALSDVETARARVNAQRAQLSLSTSTLERNQDLAQEGHVSVQLLDELTQQAEISKANLGVARANLVSASARAEQVAVRLSKTQLKAPYTARIQMRHLDEGSITAPGEPVITLVEHKMIKAKIGFPERMVNSLRIGDTYEFTVNDQQLPGRLDTILPSVDAVNGTVTAQFILDADNLYGGSLAELNLSIDVTESGFWVPISSLSESQRGLWSVLVVTSDESGGQRVEARLIEIIHRGNRSVYVRGTLEAGDLIIDSGTGRIVPGQAVTVASRSKMKADDVESTHPHNSVQHGT